jgi:hypothetical protein
MKITDLTKYNMKNKIEFFCNDYIPSENLKWENVSLQNQEIKHISNKCDFLFRARLYNKNEKSKMVFLNLYMYHNKTKGKYSLVIRGRLNNWYFQNFDNKKLTNDEYNSAFELILTELELEKKNLFYSKTGVMDLAMRIYLSSVFLKKYERVVKIIYE